MKKIRIESESDSFYSGDVARMVQIFKDRDLDVAPEQAKELWERFSDSMAAGWLELPKDDGELFQSVSCYFTVLEDWES